MPSQLLYVGTSRILGRSCLLDLPPYIVVSPARFLRHVDPIVLTDLAEGGSTAEVLSTPLLASGPSSIEVRLDLSALLSDLTNKDTERQAEAFLQLCSFVRRKLGRCAATLEAAGEIRAFYGAEIEKLYGLHLKGKIRYGDPTKAAAFAGTIVHNDFIDWVRRHRRQDVVSYVDEEWASPLLEGPAPDRLLEIQNRRAQTDRRLNRLPECEEKLPDRLKEIFRYRYHQGHTLAETAVLVQKSEIELRVELEEEAKEKSLTDDETKAFLTSELSRRLDREPKNALARVYILAKKTEKILRECVDRS